MTAKDIKELRQKLGLSQEKFARLVGVSLRSINRWEHDREKPSQLALMRLKQVQESEL